MVITPAAHAATGAVIVTAPAAFLANLLVLEGEALSHYQRCAEVALAAQDTELEAFFLGLVETTQIEINEARAAGGNTQLATFAPLGQSPVTENPKVAIQVGGNIALELHRHLCHALDLMRCSHHYYLVATVAVGGDFNPIAQALATETAAHLTALEGWIIRCTP